MYSITGDFTVSLDIDRTDGLDFAVYSERPKYPITMNGSISIPNPFNLNNIWRIR